MQMNSPLSTFFEEKEEKNLATFFRFLTKNKFRTFSLYVNIRMFMLAILSGFSKKIVKICSFALFCVGIC